MGSRRDPNLIKAEVGLGGEGTGRGNTGKINDLQMYGDRGREGVWICSSLGGVLFRCCEATGGPGPLTVMNGLWRQAMEITQTPALRAAGQLKQYEATLEKNRKKERKKALISIVQWAAQFNLSKIRGGHSERCEELCQPVAETQPANSMHAGSLLWVCFTVQQSQEMTRFTGLRSVCYSLL